MARTVKEIASEFLRDQVNKWVKEEVNKWAGREIREIPDSIQKQYWCVEQAWKDGDISELEYKQSLQIMWNHDLPVLERAIKDFICFSLFRKRFTVLEERAGKGDEEARRKVLLAFTEDGHLTGKAFGIYKREIRPHNQDAVWWILRHQDLIPEWTLKELVDTMKRSGVKQDLVPIPEDTRETGKLLPGERWLGDARDKYTDRIRKLLNEMEIPTKGTPQDR